MLSVQDSAGFVKVSSLGRARQTSHALHIAFIWLVNFSQSERQLFNTRNMQFCIESIVLFIYAEIEKFWHFSDGTRIFIDDDHIICFNGLNLHLVKNILIIIKKVHQIRLPPPFHNKNMKISHGTIQNGL